MYPTEMGYITIESQYHSYDSISTVNCHTSPYMATTDTNSQPSREFTSPKGKTKRNGVPLRVVSPEKQQKMSGQDPKKPIPKVIARTTQTYYFKEYQGPEFWGDSTGRYPYQGTRLCHAHVPITPGYSGCVTNIHGSSFAPADPEDLMTVAIMNETQPGFPDCGYGIIEGVTLRDKWVSTYNNPAGHSFPHSARCRNVLLNTYISAIIPYSQKYRNNIMNALRAQGANPVQEIPLYEVPTFTYEHSLNEAGDAMAPYYTLLSPGGPTWGHTVWLAPTLLANSMYHPVEDEEHNLFLQFDNQAELLKLLKILDYFEVPHQQVVNTDLQAENELFGSDDELKSDE